MRITQSNCLFQCSPSAKHKHKRLIVGFIKWAKVTVWCTGRVHDVPELELPVPLLHVFIQSLWCQEGSWSSPCRGHDVTDGKLGVHGCCCPSSSENKQREDVSKPQTELALFKALRAYTLDLENMSLLLHSCSSFITASGFNMWIYVNENMSQCWNKECMEEQNNNNTDIMLMGSFRHVQRLAIRFYMVQTSA